MAPGAVSGCSKGIHRGGRYPVSVELSTEEGKKEPTFRSAPMLGDRPHTGELIAPLSHSLLLQSLSLRTCGLQIGRRPIVYQAGGDGSRTSRFRLKVADGGGLSTVVCVRFYVPEGGTALYHPLC